MCVRLDMDWDGMHILRPGYGEMGLWWGWDAILNIWMEVRCALDGGETRPRWRWGMNIGALVESWYLDGGETVHGCRWDKNLGSWMSVKQDLEALISTFWDLGGFEVTWKQPRCSFRDLDGVETSLDGGGVGNVLRWTAHLKRWLNVKRKY